VSADICYYFAFCSFCPQIGATFVIVMTALSFVILEMGEMLFTYTDTFKAVYCSTIIQTPRPSQDVSGTFF